MRRVASGHTQANNNKRKSERKLNLPANIIRAQVRPMVNVKTKFDLNVGIKRRKQNKPTEFSSNPKHKFTFSFSIQFNFAKTTTQHDRLAPDTRRPTLGQSGAHLDRPSLPARRQFDQFGPRWTRPRGSGARAPLVGEKWKRKREEQICGLDANSCDCRPMDRVALSVGQRIAGRRR